MRKLDRVLFELVEPSFRPPQLCHSFANNPLIEKMAKKRKSTAGNGPSNEQNLAPSQPQFPDRDRLPSFSSTMPPRIKAPKLPDLPRAMAATQPEQAEKKASKKKNKNKKRRPSSADEAAQPQTVADEDDDDDEAKKPAPPGMKEKNVFSDGSSEQKRKNKKKRQSHVQAEAPVEVQSEVRFMQGAAYPGVISNPAQMEKTLVETVLPPKKKKKLRHLEVQEDEPVAELAPESTQKKTRRHSELSPVQDVPIPKVPILNEPAGHEDQPTADNAERQRKKKERHSTSDKKLKKEKRHSIIPPVEEVPIHEEPAVEPTPAQKSKKEKRHSKVPPVEEFPIHEEPVVESIPDQKLNKKNKTKRTSKLPVSQEHVVPEEAIIASTPDHKPKKEKKKKHTMELPPVEEHVVSEEPTPEEEAVIEPSTERQRKKKNKRHSEAQLGDESFLHDMLVFQAVLQATQDKEASVEASPQRKRKKQKRHPEVEEAQLDEETTAPEPAVAEVAPEQKKKEKEKKKSKRHSAAAEVPLPEGPVAEVPEEEEAILEAPSERKGKNKRHSEVLDVDQSAVEPSSKSERKTSKSERKKNKKKQLAQPDVQPDEDNAVPEDPPASPPASKSSKKKRRRTEDPDQEHATSAKKSRKHAPPSEADELELQASNRPSLLASHLNGDTSAVASLWEQRLERQQTVPATQPTSTVDGDYLRPTAERESPVLHGDSRSSRRREESIETTSQAEERGLSTSGHPQVGDDHMHVDSPRMSPFANDDIESVASDEEGRPLGNRAPSIESDADRLPDSPSPEPANAGSSDGPQDTADIEMHDVESDLDNAMQQDEEEISAAPYPEPDISSTTSTHSRPPSRQETESPPQDSEDEHRQVSSPATEESQAEPDNNHGRLGEEVAHSPCPEPELSERAKGKRPVRPFNQGTGMLQDPDGEAQQSSSAPRSATRSERTTEVLDVDGGKDDAPAAATSPASKPRKTPKSRMSTARKPKTPFFEQAEVEKATEAEAATAQAFAELPGSEVAEPSKSPPKKNPRKKAAPKPKREALADGERLIGRMSPEEVEALQGAVESFLQAENLSTEEFKDLVHGTPANWRKDHRFRGCWTRLWPLLMAACPRRNRKSIQTKTRLLYNSWVGRGAWTPEQEKELVELVKKYTTSTGAEWTKIGRIINRYGEDCREHWRNKMICGPERNVDYWTEEEEQMLYEAVQKAVTKIKGDMDLAEIRDKGVSKVVDWIRIGTEGMNGRRDRLQCSKKWAQFLQRGLVHDDIATVMLAGETWRLVRKDLKEIKADDKYKIVKAIADSNVVLDSRIPWEKIEVDILNNRFQRKSLTMAWKSLRKGVPGEKDMQARVCAKYILEKYEKDGVFAEVVPMTEDDIVDGSELPSESTSAAEGGSAAPGAEILGIPLTRQRKYRKPRVKSEPGESSSMASIPQEPKPKPATKATPKAATRKPPTKAAKPPTKASTSTSAARKTFRSEEFVHDSDADDEVPESAQEEEVPESVQEEDVPAPPRSPSIELGQDTSSPPTARSSGSGRIKTVAKRTVIVDSDTEDAAPAVESSPAKRTRASRRKAAVIVDEEEEEEDVKPTREELATPAKGKRTYKRKRTVVEEEQEEPEAGPSLSVDMEAATPAQKRRKTSAATVGDWEVPVGEPLRAVSVISSTMDDMEDIQATLPLKEGM